MNETKLRQDHSRRLMHKIIDLMNEEVSKNDIKPIDAYKACWMYLAAGYSESIKMGVRPCDAVNAFKNASVTATNAFEKMYFETSGDNPIAETDLGNA